MNKKNNTPLRFKKVVVFDNPEEASYTLMFISWIIAVLCLIRVLDQNTGKFSGIILFCIFLFWVYAFYLFTPKGRKVYYEEIK